MKFCTVDGAQRWWDSIVVDLKLRRGQSGIRLLNIAGYVGDSPYLLKAAVQKLIPVLNEWVLSNNAPEWAVKLLRDCRRCLRVLGDISPLGSELYVREI